MGVFLVHVLKIPKESKLSSGVDFVNHLASAGAINLDPTLNFYRSRQALLKDPWGFAKGNSPEISGHRLKYNILTKYSQSARSPKQPVRFPNLYNIIHKFTISGGISGVRHEFHHQIPMDVARSTSFEAKTPAMTAMTRSRRGRDGFLASFKNTLGVLGILGDFSPDLEEQKLGTEMGKDDFWWTVGGLQ